ncbi:RES domain-containing protein [Catalinimonas alkaloidigena]|uniref:RES family NAD+ phosphorylase n=1 Tax=Catalinimonas alkaloidigena TaxID=1075417 RepID=UPI002405C28E|nr:RES family NAD+ phosphorylase [Catalinimonas alkaloidigena]MDF9796988.1 RES domain-containing protein [Catalinimonas alkaloidigena]
MYIYRLCKAQFTALDGYGAFLYGGRWNLPGKAVVYTAENRALAALEFLVGVEHHRQLGELTMLTIEVPDNVKKETIGIKNLPDGWWEFPAPQSVARLGEAWLEKGKFCVLKVPSVHIPDEYNYLINPRHPDFGKISVAEQKPFGFDHRLMR